MQIITSKSLSFLTGTVAAGHEQPELGVRYCPSMDLIATFPLLKRLSESDQKPYLEDEEDPYAEHEAQEPSVEVYRLNGQKVFEISIESEKKLVGITDVAWRSDGVILAILSSDNIIRLVNSFSGKVVHKFPSISTQVTATVSPTIPFSPTHSKSPSTKRFSNVRGEPPKKRRCISTTLSYTTHFLDSATTQNQLDHAGRESGVVLDDLLGLNADLEKLLKAKADLPKQLINVDVEAFLPKLSTLPGSSFGEDDVFSTRTSLDAMLHPAKSGMRSTNVNLLMAGHDDGIMHLRIFDSFEVGDIDINRTSHMPPGLILKSPTLMTGHPLGKEVFIIAEEEGNGPTATHTRSHGAADAEGRGLHLLRLEMKFIQQSSHNLPILATKSTQLHNLIRYLRQVEKQLSREVKTAFDLPARFIRNVNEDLAEQDGEGSNFETAAHHAIVTGDVHGKMREWLVEQVTDRGVKRWEKSVGDCLDLIRRMISENWNPAVERAGVVVSRLAGLAAANTALGIDKRVVEGLQDTVDVMGIIGEDIVRDVSAEIVEFSAFIIWLKWEVEAAALEETSERLDELRESSDHSDVRRVLKYIAEGLRESSVKKYMIGTLTDNQSIVDNIDDVGFYKKIKSMRSNDPGRPQIPSLAALLNRLTSQCEKLFEQIAETLKKSVLVDYILKLPQELDEAVMDAKIISRSDEVGQKGGLQEMRLFIAGKHKTRKGHISCTTVSMMASRTRKHESFDYDIGGAGEILDVKFAGDEELMVLASAPDETRIFGSNLKSGSEWSVRHVFDANDGGFTSLGMKPGKLEINGRKGRRAIAVLDEKGRGYGVFDMDTGPDNGVEGDDQVMTG